MQNTTVSRTLPPELDDLDEQEYEEAGMGEAQKVSLTTSARLRMFALIINVIVISELFIAMYFAAQDQDNLTPIFFKVFFSMLVPTIIATIVGRRVIAKAER